MSSGFEIVECGTDDCDGGTFHVGRYDDGTIELRCAECGHLMWGGRPEPEEDVVDASEETGNAPPEEVPW